MSIQNSQYRFIFSVTRWGQTNTNQQNDNVLHQDIVTEINIHFLRGGGCCQSTEISYLQRSDDVCMEEQRSLGQKQ